MGAICRPTANTNYLRGPVHLSAPLIAKLLADEYWFGNKPPSWPGAPTSNDAKKAVNDASSGCDGLLRIFGSRRSWPKSWPVAKDVADA